MKEKKEKKEKIILTPEQKKAQRKKRAKTAGIVILVIIMIFALLMGIFAIVNVVGNKGLLEMASSFEKVVYQSTDPQLVPERQDANDNLFFVTNDEFKVIQFTDIHIGGGFASHKKDAMALNAVASMITAEKPDLVVVTGDVVYPVPVQSGSFNNKASTEIFATMMESLGVYWTFTFGNHDTEAYSFYDRKDLVDFYAEKDYKYCLFEENDPDNKIDGYGNQIIEVKNTSGIVTQAIATIDSHSYTDGDVFGAMWKYDNIKQSQVDWFKSEMIEINNQNRAIDPTASDVNAMAYFHIPLVEYLDAFNEYHENGKKDTANVQVYDGWFGESKQVVYSGIGEDNFFEIGVQYGLRGVFCGHDHYNNVTMDYKKEIVNEDGDKVMSPTVRFTYGMSIDYLAYAGIHKEGTQRGCTVISVQPDGSFDVELKNYYTDFDSIADREEVEMQPLTNNN